MTATITSPMDRNTDGILTGNEDPADFANYLATIIEDAMGYGEQPLRSIRVTEGFQPYLTIKLTNGAEWQLTPVRSAWPDDGTSTQWADDEPCCEECGTSNLAEPGDSLCQPCWRAYCDQRGLDPADGCLREDRLHV